jgi:hypothetical protein
MILSEQGVEIIMLCHVFPRNPLLPMKSHGTNFDKEDGQTIRGDPTTPPA